MRRLTVVPATLAVVASLFAVAPAPAAPAAAKAAPSCTVSGTPGDDVLVGTPGDDVICGGTGDDVLKGRGGDDRLVGGRGDDLLVGGGGTDLLLGGRGDDTLKGRHDGGASDDLNCGRGAADRAVADSADVVRASCELPNHPPTDLSLSNDAVAENRPVGTLVGRFSVVDPDAHDSHTFRLVPGPGAADNASFAIDGRRLRTAAMLDHEADPELTIRVRVTDAHGASRSERFRITVTDVDENGAPAAVDDAVSMPEDTALELPASGPGSPAANDTDPNGDPLSVVAVSGAEGGTVSLAAGTIRFEPEADLCGVAAGGFDYTVSDGHDGTAVGHVTVDITCVDDPPHAVDDAATLVEGAGATAIDVLANDTDSDGGPMTIASVTQAAHGTVAITGAGSGLTYRPDAGFCDDAAPDPFTYTLNGGSTATVRVTVSCVDDPPHAVDDVAAMDEDSPATAISVLANDTDPDGGPKTIVSVTQPANGTVVITGGGSGLTYQPAPDYCSSGTPDSFTYTLAGGSTATVAVTVGCVPDPPVAVNDARTITEDDPATSVDVLANDTDVDGGPKQVTAVTQPANGTVVITGGGTGLTYQPNANYCNAPPGTAPDTFTYTLNGGSVGQVRMTVTCVDDLPTAVDDATTVTEDDPATAIGVLGNDTDIDAGPKTIGSVTQPTNGTVVITGGGTGLTYAPNANYCNDPLGTPDTFTYTLNGGSSATVSVTVTCVQDPPVAVDDATTVTEDDPATAVDVLTNDTDVDGGPKQVAAVSQPANGTVVITGGGTGLTYAPNANYCNAPPGTTLDTFTYTLNGGSTGTVSVTVTCVDDNPTAVDDAKTVAEDSGATAVGVLANDANADGGPISISSVTQPTNGTVVITGGGTGLSYAPNANYCNNPPGTTPDTFTYTLTPGGSSATVTVTVTCVDDAPVAVDDATTVTEDDSATTIDVLANDTDVDGGTKVVTGVTGAAHGTVAITNSGADLTYEPDPNYCNTPPGTTLDSFSYTLNGGSSGTVTVTVTCVDDNPTAVDDATTVAEDSGATAVGVLANDANADGGPISITSVTQPANGTVVITGGGTGLTYAPNANYCNAPPGTTLDTFTYTLTPGGSSATVTVTVTCVDDAPAAVDDAKTVAEDSGTSAVDVLANDTDVDGGAMSITSVTQPTNGTVVITGGGTGLTYAPNANYCNTPPGTTLDTFTYTLAPGGSSATVSVTVTCVDDNPVAVDDTKTVFQNAAATAVDVLANDTDIDGGAKQVASVTQPANGTVVITGGGTGLTYQPNTSYCNDPPGNTPDTFTYTLNPGGSTATVSVTVLCDVPPTAVDDTATVSEDSGANAVDVLGNDTDIDGGPMQVDSVTQPTNGTVVITGGGTGLTYAPAANYCNNPPGIALDTFTYTLNGGDSGTVTVTVNCVDDNPVAVADATTVAEDSGASAVGVLGNDTDVDGGAMSIGSVTQPTNGAVVITGGGTGLTYAPNANYCNDPPGTTPDTFTYTLNGGSSATVSMTVTCVADPPTLTSSAGPTSYTENDAATVVDNGVTISNPDGLTITDGSVEITGNAEAGADVLDWVDNNLGDTITEGASTAQHVVLTGNGTTAEYVAALRAVTYANTSNDPSTLTRTVTFSVTTSAGAASDTIDVTVSAVDDPPVGVGDAATVLEDAAATAVPVLTNDTDVDAGPKVIASASDPTNGTVVLTGGLPGAHTGLTYQPDPNYCNDPPGTTPDTFTYTLNGGSTATVSMTVTCVNDAPVADNESLTVAAGNNAVGNTRLGVGTTPAEPSTSIARSGATDALTGDTDVDGPGPLVVTSAGSNPAADNGLTQDGGTVTIAANGDFTYSPPANDPGCTDTSDSFDYVVSDQFPGTAGTDIGTITIEIASCVWYVDSSVAGPGTGTSTDPFKALSGVNVTASDADGAGDTIMILDNSSYAGGLPLEDNQLLRSKSAGLVVGSSTIVTATGTNPTISNASGNALTLASNNTIQGISLGTTPAGSAALSGSNVGTATMNTVTPGAINNTTGGAVDISSGALAMTFTSITSTGATTSGIRLANVTGSFTGSGGAISNATGTDIDISGGASADDANITYDGSIADSSGTVLAVAGQGGGLKDFNGAIGTAGSPAGAVSLTNNTGASIRLDGGTILSTGATAALSATGGGTVVVTDPNALGTAPDNTLATTTGTALNVANTTIGANGLTFRSISSNGAANGIVLNATGSSGGLTVTGNGGSCTSAATCTGGAVQNSSGPGISLTSVGGGVSLTRIAVTAGTDDGIRGTTVTGLSLANSVILNNGNAVGERGIDMLHLTGSGGISSSTISGSAEANIRIENDTATALTAFNVTSSTISDTNMTTGDDGILFLNDGSGAMNISVTGSTFTDNKGDHFQAASDADASGSMNIVFDNNTLTTTAGNDPNVIGGGITLNTSGTLDITFHVGSNSIQQAFDDAINMNLDPGSQAGATFVGTVTGNTIGTAGVADSGSESSNAVTFAAKGAGTATVAVTNNTIRQWGNGYGIFVGATEGSPVVNATVTGNTVKEPGSFAINGIRVDAGATSGPPVDASTLCVGLTGNDVTGSAKSPPADTDIRLRQRFNTTIRLPGYGGANNDATAVNAFVSGNNTGGPTVSSANNVGGGGGGFVGGAACLTPP